MMVTTFHVESPHSSATLMANWLSSHTSAGLSRSAGPGRVDCWNKIQSQVPSTAVPYIQPHVQQSRDLMSQTSLEMCTEILGSETGSNDLDHQLFSISPPYMDENKTCEQDVFSEVNDGRREMLPSMNYHCTGRRSPTRSFPPPLPSISRREATCFQMRPYRCEDRLIIEAVAIPSRNYLHAHRLEGRLVLASSYQISSTAIASNNPHDQHQHTNCETKDKNDEHVNSKEVEEVDDQEEEKEEVEVVDRGMVVEVKVSTQQQQQKGTKKILRSSIVINKFVGGTPLSNDNCWLQPPISSLQRKMVPRTTTAAAAALAASSITASPVVTGHNFPLTENKLLFTYKGAASSGGHFSSGSPVALPPPEKFHVPLILSLSPFSRCNVLPITRWTIRYACFYAALPVVFSPIINTTLSVFTFI